MWRIIFSLIIDFMYLFSFKHCFLSFIYLICLFKNRHREIYFVILLNLTGFHNNITHFCIHSQLSFAINLCFLLNSFVFIAWTFWSASLFRDFYLKLFFWNNALYWLTNLINRSLSSNLVIGDFVILVRNYIPISVLNYLIWSCFKLLLLSLLFWSYLWLYFHCLHRLYNKIIF